MTGKHRRPRTTGRTVATAAAALTAGALPLVAAGAAVASAAPDPLAVAAPLTAGNPIADSGLGAKAVELNGKIQDLSAGADQLEHGADQLATQIGSGAAVKDLLHQAVPANPKAVPGELAPAVLRDGTVGTLTGTVGQRTTAMAANVAAQARPMAAQLQQGGVPSVGDATASLSRTQMPMFGTVGALTTAIPVSAVFGTPVMDSLGAASAL
jgi:X-X-X-Leu-X-X-Gly heptad repeat protein